MEREGEAPKSTPATIYLHAWACPGGVGEREIERGVTKGEREMKVVRDFEVERVSVRWKREGGGGNKKDKGWRDREREDETDRQTDRQKNRPALKR